MTRQYTKSTERFTSLSFKIIRIEADDKYQAVVTGQFTLRDAGKTKELPAVQLRAGQSALIDGVVIKTRIKFVDDSINSEHDNQPT
ncbi:MAG: YceI family protein [Bacteroidales bacterium]|nr:YceI family protein [Bacteroidales bacterium]